jgi:hypothetical protein
MASREVDMQDYKVVAVQVIGDADPITTEESI